MLKSREIAKQKLKLKQEKKKKGKNTEKDEIIIIDDEPSQKVEKTEKTETNDSQPNIIKDIIDSTIIDNGLDTGNKKNRKRKIVYCDYNLSEIVDTKGGFLIEKSEEDYNKEKEKEKKIKHNIRNNNNNFIILS